MGWWNDGLDRHDWLLDGTPIRSRWQREKFNKLDWSRAWMDLGPSPAGNYGPYWHVPFDFEGEQLWARLYPKLLVKWMPVVRQACLEARSFSEKALTDG